MNTRDDLDVRSAIQFNDSIEIFSSRDCFHIVTHFQKLNFFIFRNCIVVLSILSANSICKMSLSKTQIFLFFESENYV